MHEKLKNYFSQGNGWRHYLPNLQFLCAIIQQNGHKVGTWKYDEKQVIHQQQITKTNQSEAQMRVRLKNQKEKEEKEFQKAKDDDYDGDDDEDEKDAEGEEEDNVECNKKVRAVEVDEEDEKNEEGEEENDVECKTKRKAKADEVVKRKKRVINTKKKSKKRKTPEVDEVDDEKDDKYQTNEPPNKKRRLEISLPPSIELEETMSPSILPEEQEKLRMMGLNSASNQQQHKESVQPLTLMTDDKQQDPVQIGRRLAETQLSDTEKGIISQQARQFNNHNVRHAVVSQQCRSILQAAGFPTDDVSLKSAKILNGLAELHEMSNEMSDADCYRAWFLLISIYRKGNAKILEERALRLYDRIQQIKEMPKDSEQAPTTTHENEETKNENSKEEMDDVEEYQHENEQKNTIKDAKDEQKHAGKKQEANQNMLLDENAKTPELILPFCGKETNENEQEPEQNQKKRMKN